MLILQSFSGGSQFGGGPTVQHGRNITGHYYPGGATGEPQPEPMPTGPLLVCWQDPDTGQYRSEVMGAVEQDPDTSEYTINPGAIAWEQVLAWWHLSEAEAEADL